MNLEVENQSVDVRIYRCIQLAGLTRASLSLLKYYGIFNRIKVFVTKNVARQLYFAFVYSKIKYGIEVYGGCSQEQLHRLQVVQSGLIKLLLQLNRRTHTDYLHKHIRLLNVIDIYRQQLLCFVSNSTYNRLPTTFNNYFIQRPATYNIRNRGLEVNYGRTNFGLLTVKNTTARLWNSIPIELKEKASQLNFRKHIAVHYISGYNGGRS